MLIGCLPEWVTSRGHYQVPAKRHTGRRQQERRSDITYINFFSNQVPVKRHRGGNYAIHRTPYTVHSVTVDSRQ